MIQYRQVLERLRAGDSVREIARTGTVGRSKVGVLRAIAQDSGWLDPKAVLPEDETIAAALGKGRKTCSSGSRVTPSPVAEHVRPEARNSSDCKRWECGVQAQAVGSRCAELVAWLLLDRTVARLRAAQGVLELGRRYGPTRLESACARALAYASPNYPMVKTILRTGADRQPLDRPYTPQAYIRSRFMRSAADLFGSDPGTGPRPQPCTHISSDLPCPRIISTP